MPTWAKNSRFDRDLDRLTSAQFRAFIHALRMFIADLEAGGPFRRSLRVKDVRGHPGVFEMTWAPDGRATFHYGNPVIDGHPHIVWRRIGTHDIFSRP